MLQQVLVTSLWFSRLRYSLLVHGGTRADESPRLALKTTLVKAMGLLCQGH